jgi:hypothetical protein
MSADGLDTPTPDDAAPEPASTAHGQDEASAERLITLSDGVVAIAAPGHVSPPG